MKILLIGACGRMGKNVAEAAAERGIGIAAGVDVVSAPLAFPLYPRIADVKEEADVVIDFSSASGLDDTLFWCEEKGVPAVLILFLCSMGTAAVWEIMEFAADLLAGQASQGHVPPEIAAMLEEQGLTGIRAAWEGMKYVSVLDTDLDMLCHMGGTLLFCLHYALHLATGRNLGMGTLTADIRGADMNTRQGKNSPLRTTPPKQGNEAGCRSRVIKQGGGAERFRSALDFA